MPHRSLLERAREMRAVRATVVARHALVRREPPGAGMLAALGHAPAETPREAAEPWTKAVTAAVGQPVTMRRVPVVETPPAEPQIESAPLPPPSAEPVAAADDANDADWMGSELSALFAGFTLRGDQPPVPRRADVAATPAKAPAPTPLASPPRASAPSTQPAQPVQRAVAPPRPATPRPASPPIAARPAQPSTSSAPSASSAAPTRPTSPMPAAPPAPAQSSAADVVQRVVADLPPAAPPPAVAASDPDTIVNADAPPLASPTPAPKRPALPPFVARERRTPVEPQRTIPPTPAPAPVQRAAAQSLGTQAPAPTPEPPEIAAAAPAAAADVAPEHVAPSAESAAPKTATPAPSAAHAEVRQARRVEPAVAMPKREAGRSSADPDGGRPAPPRPDTPIFEHREAGRAPEDWIQKFRNQAARDAGAEAPSPRASAPPQSLTSAAPSTAAPSTPASFASSASSAAPTQAPRTTPAPAAPIQRTAARPAPPAAAARVEPVGDAARAFLRPLVGVDPATVRVHRGEAADATIASHGADALASGDDILLPRSADERTPESLGLIAHELTHVARSRTPRFVPPVAQNAEPSRAGLPSPSTASEESIAQTVEMRVRDEARSHALPRPPAAPIAAPPAPSPAPRTDAGPPSVMRADVSRPSAPRADASSGVDAVDASAGEPAPWGDLPAPWEPFPDIMASLDDPSSFADHGDARSDARSEPRAESAQPSPSSIAPSPVHAARHDRPARPGGSFDTSDRVVQRAPTAPPADAAPPTVTHVGPDIDELAQKVYAALRRRLATDRRRGA